MEQKNKTPIKREMPEHIRKMFEQKNKQNSNVVSAPVAPQEEPKVQEQETLEQETNQVTEPVLEEPKTVVAEETPDEVESQDLESLQEQVLDSQVQEEVTQEAKPKKEKSTKEKKQKPQKEEKNEQKPKKKLSKKNKIIIGVVSALIFVALAIILVVVLLPKASKLPTPEVKVYSLSNQTRIHVDENDKCDYYEFFVQKTGEDVVYFKSSTNEVSLKSILKDTPGEYTIWARYGSTNTQIVSDNSKKQTYKNIYKLQTPQVSFSADKTKLIWEPIANAKEYKIYYTDTDCFTVANPSATQVVSFDLQEFKNNNLQAGLYTLYVQAVYVPQNSEEIVYYENSELSSFVEYEHKFKLEPVLGAIFSKATNLLSINLDTLTTSTLDFEVQINFVGKQVTNVYSAQSLNENLVFDLSLAIENNNFTSLDIVEIKVTALGYNAFVENSTAYSATLV